MARSWRWLFALQALLVVFGLSTRASAQQKTNAAILGLDSDDAERQADALSSALRTRARQQPGWTISDNTDSIALITAALRCPSHPDATCEKHIGEQLKTDRFFWGSVKKIGPGQLSAEVHYWQRGKPDSSTKEIFPESIKDANDPNARTAATHIFEKLSGAGPLNGSVTIKAGDGDGAVIVDGEQKGSLDHGTAKLDLPPGSHSIEVRASGYEASKQTVTVVASNEALVSMTLVPVAAPPPVPHKDDTAPEDQASSGHGKGRLIVGLALIGLGVVSEVIAGVEAISFYSNKSTWDGASTAGCSSGTALGTLGPTNSKYGDLTGCGTLGEVVTRHQILCTTPGIAGAATQDQCSAYDKANSAIAPGIIFASAGVVLAGAGVIVILTAPKNSEGPPPPQAGKPIFLPLISPTMAGMSVGVPF